MSQSKPLSYFETAGHEQELRASQLDAGKPWSTQVKKPVHERPLVLPAAEASAVEDVYDVEVMHHQTRQLSDLLSSELRSLQSLQIGHLVQPKPASPSSSSSPRDISEWQPPAHTFSRPPSRPVSRKKSAPTQAPVFRDIPPSRDANSRLEAEKLCRESIQNAYNRLCEAYERLEEDNQHLREQSCDSDELRGRVRQLQAEIDRIKQSNVDALSKRLADQGQVNVQLKSLLNSNEQLQIDVDRRQREEARLRRKLQRARDALKLCACGANKKGVGERAAEAEVYQVKYEKTKMDLHAAQKALVKVERENAKLRAKLRRYKQDRQHDFRDLSLTSSVADVIRRSVS